jgi:MerR, DNA binding
MGENEVPVGQAARVAGLTPKAVRLSEAIGNPGAGGAHAVRLPHVHRGAVQLLRFVRRARALGFSVGEIRQLVNAGQHEAPPCATVVSPLERHVHAADVRVAQLTRTRGVLSGLLEQVRASDGQGRPVRLCGLLAPRSQ